MSRIITSILVLSVFILFLIPFLKRLHIPSKMKKLRNNRMMKRNIKKIPDFTGKYFITVDQCFQTLYEMLIGAKHEIHYSCFALDMYTVLPYHNNRLPLYQIFNNLAKDGVKIHLLYNSTGEYSNQNPSELIKLLDPKINIYSPSALLNCSPELNKMLAICFSYRLQQRNQNIRIPFN